MRLLRWTPTLLPLLTLVVVPPVTAKGGTVVGFDPGPAFPL